MLRSRRSGKNRGEIRPSHKAPVEPLAGCGGVQSPQESESRPGNAHGRSLAPRYPEHQKADCEVFNSETALRAVGLSVTSDCHASQRLAVRSFHRIPGTRTAA